MTLRTHAIVLGASMSGLTAARVLSDHFQHVTVLDRDTLPSEGQNRRGIPQAHHAHGLLSGGRTALERLFPGIVDELVARGAADSELSREMRFYNEGLPLATVASDLRGLLVSRPMLEGRVRARVQALANVTVQDRVEVLDLTASGGAVSGVRVKERDGFSKALTADLVVDATGRSSRLGSWLERLGFATAPEERVRIDLGYASCTYRRRPDQAGGYKGVIVAVAPPNRRSGVALAQEGDRWIVTLSGYLGDHPEASHTGMREFARSLASPALYELLRDAEPLTEPTTMRFPFSLRRRYEQLNDFPEGLLAVGDTLCSFNPSFGQGMSVAALEALALRDCLARPGARMWKRMFAASAKLIDTPWTIAVGADLAFPEVDGKRTAIGNLIGRYVSALRRGAVHDEQLALAFLRVAQLIDEPAALLAPRLMLRTARANMGTPTLAPELGQRESFAG